MIDTDPILRETIDDKQNMHLDDYEVFDEYDDNIEPQTNGKQEMPAAK